LLTVNRLLFTAFVYSTVCTLH